MNPAITLTAAPESFEAGFFLIVLVLGSASLLFLLFCLGCVGSDFFASCKRRTPTFAAAPPRLKLVLPNPRAVSHHPPSTRRIRL